MASKKKSVNTLAQLQRAYNQRLSSVNDKADAVIAQYEADGTPLSAAQIRDLKHQLALRGGFDLADEGASEEEVASPVLPSTSASMPQMSAVSAQEAYNRDDTGLLERLSDLGPSLRAGAKEGLAALLEAPVGIANAAEYAALRPMEKLTGLDFGTSDRLSNPQFVQDEAKRLRQEASDIRTLETSSGSRAGGDVIAEADGFTGTVGALLRNPGVLGDELAKQAGQMLPTIAGGGPTGVLALSAAQAGSQNAQSTYERAKQKGMSDEDAGRAADLAFGVSAGANYLIPKAISGGTSLEKLMTGQLTKEALGSTASVVAKPLIGEAVTEAFTESVEQIGANLAAGDSWDDQLGKSAAMGLVLGAAMGAAPAAVRARQNSQGWADLETSARKNAARAVQDSTVAPTTSLEQAVAPTPEAAAPTGPVPTAEEMFAARDKERADAKAAQEEAAFAEVDDANAKNVREMELRDAAKANPTSSLAQQLSGIGTQVRRAETAQATTPTETATATEVDPLVEQAVAEDAIRTRAAKDAQKLLDADKKAVEKAAGADLAAFKKDHAAKRKEEMTRLAESSRSITDPKERVKAVTEGIVNWDGANPTPTAVPEGYTAPKPAPVATRKRPAPVKKTAPVKTDVVQEAEVKVVPAKTGPLDDRVSALTEKMGLQMEEAAAKSGRKPDKAKFKNDANNVITELVKKGDSSAASTLRLIDQGKLVLAPNPESVGVEASGNGAAMYVPKDGKMYLWTDRAKKGDATGNIIKAYHEATHAGQFNPSKGRSTVMQQIMGRDKATSAEDTIRKAAKGGNVLAKRAVAAAQKAAPVGTEVNSLEVLPYFVGEVAKSRNTTLGSLNSVGRDILSGAKKLLKGAGVDGDVSFNDVYVATKDVANEIASTKLEPKDFQPVEMIYPSTAKGFEQAKKDGRVYLNETGHELFVLSDADAHLKPDAIRDLSNLGPAEAYTLADIMNHPVLFEQMPKAKNIQIGVTKGKGAWGSYSPGKNFIDISSAVVDGTASPNVKEILMHEIQHWVQDESGRAPEMFAGKASAYTPEEQKAIKEFKEVDKETNAISRRVLDKANVVGKALPSAEEKRAVMKAVTNQSNPAHYRAEALLDIADTLPEVSEQLSDLSFAFREQLNEWRDAANANNAAIRSHRKRYLNNITEGEAFFTQAYTNAPQSAIPINPELDPGFKSEKYAKGDLMRQATERRGPVNLEMTEDEDVETNEPAAKERKVPAWVTGLFRADKGLSRTHNEIIEFAITSPAGKRMEAEATMGRYDNAIGELAAAEGVSVKEMNKRVEDALAEVDPDLEGWDANLEAFDKAVAQFGEAGVALRELRDIADDLSLLMLEQRAEDPKPLTEEERKIYSKVSSNLGRYSHRSYAAHSGELGKLYSKALWNDYNEFKKAGGEDVSPIVENNYNTVNNAIDTLVNDSLMIPEDEQLYQTSSDRIDSLYSVWGSNGRAEGMSVDAKREELSEVRDRVNGDNDAMTKTAENIVKELLNLAKTQGAITTYYRGGKQNNSILKKRENIPESIRKLMGEITDPGMKFVTTVAKQAQFLASNKMFLELANNPGTDILPPGSTQPEGWEALTGEGYGPLQGYYASPNMVAAIGDVKQQIASFEQLVGMMSKDPRGVFRAGIGKAADIWGSAAATSKMMQIVFNPANMVFNFSGGAATMLMNGNVNPKYFAQAMKDAYDLVQYSVSPTNASTNATELVKYDIVDSAFVGEIKNEQYRALRTLIREMAGRERSPTMQTFANALNTTKAGWKETYAMMDVTFKIANFHREVDFLTDFYEKAGESRTEEQIKREAADTTKRTNFTFRRVAPVLKAMEAGGLTAFGPYMHEVFRTQGANFLQALSEIKRANAMESGEAATAMRNRGISRIVGQATMLSLTTAVSYALALATFGDDAEEEKKLRSLLGDMYGDQDFIQVGTDKDGYPVLMAWSRVDPYGPLTDFMRSAMNEKADVGELAAKLKETYITPRLIPQLYKAYQTFADDKKVSRKPWAQSASSALAAKTGAPDLYSELMDIGEAVGLDRRETKALTNVLENLYGPGIMTSWRETNARPVETDAMGAAVRAASYGGFTFQSLNPQKPLSFAAKDYGDSIKNGRSKLTEFFQDNIDRSENEIISTILRHRRLEKDEFKDAREVYEGALAAGMSKREANATLKSARLTKEAINSLAEGRFQSAVVSKSSIDASKKNELATAPRRERAEIERKWNNIWKLLNGADRATEDN